MKTELLSNNSKKFGQIYLSIKHELVPSPLPFFFKIYKLWTINAVCQKENKSYNLIVLTEMLIRQHELKKYQRGCIQGIQKHKLFMQSCICYI